MSKKAIVITSISPPNEVMKQFADGASAAGQHFYVVGDVTSPSDFVLQGCRYYDMKAQLKTGYTFAEECPTRHYARKNSCWLDDLKKISASKLQNHPTISKSGQLA